MCFSPSTRFLWYSNWASQISLSLQKLQHTTATAIGVPSVKGPTHRPTSVFHLFPAQDVILIWCKLFCWQNVRMLFYTMWTVDRKNLNSMTDWNSFGLHLRAFVGQLIFLIRWSMGKKTRRKVLYPICSKLSRNVVYQSTGQSVMRYFYAIKLQPTIPCILVKGLL
jgi:hypothetical protein